MRERTKDKAICPFYGKSEDLCDVGCGYISPHDVNQIIRYCSCRHNDCLKFRGLVDRFPGGVVEAASNDPGSRRELA